MDLKKIAQKSKASQGSKELAWLLDKVATIEPEIVLELGVHQGYSLQTWSEAFKPRKLIGVDRDLNYLKWHDAAFIDGDSRDPNTFLKVRELLDGEQVDFLFIDGDHTYEGVKRDFEIYSPLVRRGGIVAFDDMHLFNHPGVEVHKFWDEVRVEYGNACIHKDSNGIGILYV